VGRLHSNIALFRETKSLDLQHGLASGVTSFSFTVGLAWRDWLAWLWIPALLVMGVGCLVNASRCGRLHCYFTGPVFTLGAVYVGLAVVNIMPMYPGAFLLTLRALAMLAPLAEFPFGKYGKG